MGLVSDVRNSADNNGDKLADYYMPQIVQAIDYYPFGMEMPGRSFQERPHRFGFNGEHKMNELYLGDGNAYDYGMRVYDARVGRFLSVDPLDKKFPYWSPYQFSGNNSIRFIDLDGAEILDPLTKFFITDAAITITTKPTSAKAKVYATALGVRWFSTWCCSRNG